MNFERVYHYIVIIDSIMKHTAKKRNTEYTRRNTPRNTRRRHPPHAAMTLVEKQSLSIKIREYSFDDIIEDYKQLVQITNINPPPNHSDIAKIFSTLNRE